MQTDLHVCSWGSQDHWLFEWSYIVRLTYMYMQYAQKSLQISDNKRIDSTDLEWICICSIDCVDCIYTSIFVPPLGRIEDHLDVCILLGDCSKISCH